MACKTQILFYIFFVCLTWTQIEGGCIASQYSWCPQNCTCIASKGVLTSVDCSRQGLRSVPPRLPSVMRHLNLSRNNIQEIKSDDFLGCTSLLTLNLASNDIQSLGVPLVPINEDPTRNDPRSSSLSAVGDNETQTDRSKNSRVWSLSMVFSMSETKLETVNDGGGPFRELMSLRFLILSHNHLRVLDPHAFMSLFSLVSLDLSYNCLRHLQNGTFRNLGSLKLLNLQNNQLCPSSLTFSDNVFYGLTNLRELNIQNNFPRNTPERGCYPDGALSKLTNLERLYIDGFFSNPSCIPATGFQNLTRLSLLDFDIPDDNCKIWNVTRLFFSNINTSQNLKLSLKNCHIKTIDCQAFSYLPTLNHLDLSYNEGFEFYGFQNASMSLHKTKIKYLDLTRIHRVTFVNVYADDMKYLQNTSLETLLMKDDHIIYLDPQLSRILPTSLKVWDISWNRINDANILRTWFYLTNLEIFYVSHQNHYTYYRSTDAEYSPAETTRNLLQQKDVGEFKTPLLGLDRKSAISSYFAPQKKEIGTKVISSQEWLGLLSEFCPQSNHGFSVVKNASFSIWVPYQDNTLTTHSNHVNNANFNWGNASSFYNYTRFGWPIPKNLRQFYGTDMKLGYPILKLSFFNNHVLELINASDNMLKCFIGPVTGLPAISILDLSWNYCLVVSKYFFQNLHSLEQLYLSHNSLGASLACDVSGDIFSSLARLKKIDLSFNNIQDLSLYIFQKNRDLQFIDLSNNAIYNFDSNLSQLLSLVYIDLSVNDLTTLSQKTMNDLDVVHKTSNITVNLQKNPLRCDCSTLSFVLWCQNTPVNFAYRDRYTCRYINGSHVMFHRISQLHEEMYRLCNGPWFLTISLVLSCITMTIYAISALMYYYKHLLYFHFYLRKEEFFRHLWPLANHQMRDAFLVFDYQDVRWRRHVLEVVMPNLTREGITHHVTEIGVEEPSPGRPVRQVVQESVLRGRKTLVLLTEEVFLDEEVQMAVNMAKIVQDKTHYEVLVFLAAEQIKAKNIPPQLFRFLKTCRIRKYTPEDERFWKTLSRELTTPNIFRKSFVRRHADDMI